MSWLLVCEVLYLSTIFILPSLVFYSTHFSVYLSFVTPPSSSSLPVDPTQGHIITISKPFARSLPANPMFGLMSHAPHLPRCRTARGPFTNTGHGPPGCPEGPPHCWRWGVEGGWWGVPLGEAGITRPSREEIRGQSVKCESRWYLYHYSEKIVSTVTNCHSHWD